MFVCFRLCFFFHEIVFTLFRLENNSRLHNLLMKVNRSFNSLYHNGSRLFETTILTSKSKLVIFSAPQNTVKNSQNPKKLVRKFVILNSTPLSYSGCANWSRKLGISCAYTRTRISQRAAYLLLKLVSIRFGVENSISIAPTEPGKLEAFLEFSFNQLVS